MNFDSYTVALLIRRPDAPSLPKGEADALQDAHMAHTADLHEKGHLLVAGPVSSDDQSGLCGFSILNVDPERARALKEDDPAVRAGIYRIEAYPWILPAGILHFTPGRLPRSMAEAFGR